MVARLIATSCDEGEKVLLVGSRHCKAVGSSSVCSRGSGITASVTHTSGKVSVRMEAHRPWSSLSVRGVRHGSYQQFCVSGLCCIRSTWFGNLGSWPVVGDVDLEQVVEVDDFLRFLADSAESEHVSCFFTDIMEDGFDFVPIDSWVFKWKDTLRDEALVRLGPRLKVEFVLVVPNWKQGMFLVVVVKQSTDVFLSSGSNNVQDVLLGVTEIILSDVVPQVGLLMVGRRVAFLLRLHGCGCVEDIKAVIPTGFV